MNLVEIQKEVKEQLGNKETFNALVTTTFKGVNQQVVPRAIMEGMMRGFTFKDFLEKNIYAIPFRDTYSLVTSIDYARKIGMRSGVVGKSAPVFGTSDKSELETCTITVKRAVGEHIGEFSETVFFDEYYTGVKNGRTKPTLWDSKPRTMLAKVAEMHALRMACPEELAQSYIEEEREQEVDVVTVNPDDYRPRLEATKNLDELKTVWASLPVEAKDALGALKDELKQKYANPKV